METSLALLAPPEAPAPPEQDGGLLFNPAALEAVGQPLPEGSRIVEGLLVPDVSAAMATEAETLRETAPPDWVYVSEEPAEVVEQHVHKYGCTPTNSYIHFALDESLVKDYFQANLPTTDKVIAELAKRFGAERVGVTINFMQPGEMTPEHEDEANLKLTSEVTTVALTVKGKRGELATIAPDTGVVTRTPVFEGTAARLAMVPKGELLSSVTHAGLNPVAEGEPNDERISIGLIFYTPSRADSESVLQPAEEAA